MYHAPAIFNESSTSLLVILLSRLEPAALGCTAVISPDRPIPCANLSNNATEKSTEQGQKYTEPQYLKIDQDCLSAVFTTLYGYSTAVRTSKTG